MPLRPRLAPPLYMLFAAFLALGGCGSLVATIDHPLAMGTRTGPYETFNAFPPPNLSIYPAAMALNVGRRQALSVEITDQAGQAYNVPYTVTSLDPTVAAVGTDNALTAVHEGHTSVVVQAGGASAIVPVSVISATTGIAVAGASMRRFEAWGPVPQPLTIAGGAPASWLSTDPSVVSVDAAGQLTAHADGIAQLTAHAGTADSGPLTFVVEQRPYYETARGPAGSALIEAGTGTITLTEQVKDALGNAVASPTFQVDVPSVVGVDSHGLVTFGTTGQTLIRTLSRGIAGPDRGAFTFAVGQQPLSPALSAGSLTVSPSRLSLIVRSQATLVGRARNPQGGLVNPPLSFSASPQGLVSLDSAGHLTALKAGLATITVRGLGMTRQVPITVQPLPFPEGFHLIGPSGMTVTTLGPLNTPLQANAPDVTWQSDNPQIATVTAGGEVTAVSDGTVVIRANGGTGAAAFTLVVDQEPAFFAVHSILNGDPREIISQDTGSTFGVSATAFDFNGNPMAVSGLVSTQPQVADLKNGVLTTLGQGSTYIRALCKNVSTDNANSLYLVNMPMPPGAWPDGSSSFGASPAPSPSVSPGFSGGGFAAGLPPGVPVINPPGFSVQRNPLSVTMALGDKFKLPITVFDPAGNPVASPTPVFTSSNPALLTVSPTGVVTAVGTSAGFPTPTITVSLPGSSQVIPVTIVALPNPAFIVNASTLNLNNGSTFQLSSSQPGTVWTSSNPGLVSVNGAGNLTALGNTPAGAPVVITATNGFNVTAITVTVTPPPAGPGFTLNQAALTLQGPGTTAQLISSVPLTTTWTSSNPALVMVSATGQLTALVGTPVGTPVTITATNTATGNTILVPVTVVGTPAPDFNIDATSLSLGAVGSGGQLISSLPGTIWTSSNPALVSVDASGNLTALGNTGGTPVVITATSPDGRIINIPVTVRQVPAYFTIDAPSLPGDPHTLFASSNGDTVQLVAVVKDSNGNVMVGPFTWRADTIPGQPGPGVIVDNTGKISVFGNGGSFIRISTDGGATWSGLDWGNNGNSAQIYVVLSAAGGVDTTINLP